MRDSATWCAPIQMINSDNTIHDDRHGREHGDHETTDEQVGVGQIRIGPVKAF